MKRSTVVKILLFITGITFIAFMVYWFGFREKQEVDTKDTKDTKVSDKKVNKEELGPLRTLNIVRGKRVAKPIKEVTENKLEDDVVNQLVNKLRDNSENKLKNNTENMLRDESENTLKIIPQTPSSRGGAEKKVEEEKVTEGEKKEEVIEGEVAEEEENVTTKEEETNVTKKEKNTIVMEGESPKEPTVTPEETITPEDILEGEVTPVNTPTLEDDSTTIKAKDTFTTNNLSIFEQMELTPELFNVEVVDHSINDITDISNTNIIKDIVTEGEKIEEPSTKVTTNDINPVSQGADLLGDINYSDLLDDCFFGGEYYSDDNMGWDEFMDNTDMKELGMDDMVFEDNSSRSSRKVRNISD